VVGAAEKAGLKPVEGFEGGRGGSDECEPGAPGGPEYDMMNLLRSRDKK
jgi:hypothetical protein